MPSQGKIATPEIRFAAKSSPLRDSEHRAMSDVRVRKTACGERENEPPAIGEPVEPNVGRPGRAGIDQDDVGRRKPDPRPVALHDPDIGLPGEVRREPVGQHRVQFDRRDAAGTADQPGQDRRVIADPSADMHGMLAGPRRGVGDQRGEKRWLTVVQGPFRPDADHDIIVQIDRIAAWGRPIAAAPANDLPGAGAEEVFPPHRSEGSLDLAIAHLGRRHDLLGIGVPDDLEFGFAIHFSSHGADEPVSSRIA
jgi:hypothetical protein